MNKERIENIFERTTIISLCFLVSSLVIGLVFLLFSNAAEWCYCVAEIMFVITLVSYFVFMITSTIYRCFR